MAAITVLNKVNVPTGPFTRAQVAEKLFTGEMALDDLAFVEGLAQWTPLREVLAKVDSSTPAPAPVTLVAPSPTAPVYSYAASMVPPDHLVYAGFWLRFVAFVIDCLIVGIPVMIILAIMGGGFVAAYSLHPFRYLEQGNFQAFIYHAMALPSFSLIVRWLYFALQESSPAQATVGKLVMGLKVTSLQGGRIGFGQATGRFFSKLISSAILWIGFMMAGFTERKQALHDMIASTLVVQQ